jgi:glycosyltransferase involved in cell wall biosynthesis
MEAKDRREAGDRQATDPQVSVVIPTYNRADLLGRAIASVLAQTYSDFELFVVDDGSRDHTASVVERFGDPRIHLVRLPTNRGQSAATNAGIACARGAWIAFLDSDDEWLPQKLEWQMDRVGREPDAQPAVVYCACYRQRPNEKSQVRPKGALPEGDVIDSLLSNKQAPTPSAYMVRRDALEEVGGFDETLPAAVDIDLWLRLARAGHHFAAVAEPLVVKHDHGRGQIKTDAVAKLCGFRAMDRRWGPLRRQRLGEKAYHRWAQKRWRRMSEKHANHVRRLASSGTRAEALRYVVKMVPYLPWGARFVGAALTVAVLGRRLGRALLPRVSADSARKGRRAA